MGYKYDKQTKQWTLTDDSLSAGEQYGPELPPSHQPPPVGYDPALEWPGEEGSSQFPAFDTGSQATLSPAHTPQPEAASSSSAIYQAPPPFLRLLVLSSAILPKSQRIANLTGYTEVQIGRDRQKAEEWRPRVRCPEMEVSKVHATVFWEEAGQWGGPERDGEGRWAVVDMGSVHGTFIEGAEREEGEVEEG